MILIGERRSKNKMRKVYSKMYYHIRSKDSRIIKSSELNDNIFESIEETQNYIDNFGDTKIRDILEVDIKCPTEISE